MGKLSTIIQSFVELGDISTSLGGATTASSSPLWASIIALRLFEETLKLGMIDISWIINYGMDS